MKKGYLKEIPRLRRRPLYQGVKESERLLDKGENVCEANEGDSRQCSKSMIYMLFASPDSNLS